MTMIDTDRKPTAHRFRIDGQAVPRVRRVRRAMAILGLVAIAVWFGSERRPTGSDAGNRLTGTSGEQATDDGRLRIGTYNIHGGKGRDGRRDLDRIGEVLRGLDLVALNEVRGGGLGQSTDQAEVLGEHLGLAWLFAPAEERWWHEQFGNGVVASLPIDYWQRIPLVRRYGKGHRNVLLLGARYRGRPLRLLITHIDRGDDRERSEQLRQVGELFLALAEPVVLLGDLNTSAHEPDLARLLARPGVHDPLAEAMGPATPDRRIDWILSRGLHGVDGGMVDSPASDHAHYWVELAWPKSIEPGIAATTTE